MHFEHELNEMVNRMFGGSLQNSILAAYQQELKESDFGFYEEEYHAGKAALATLLGQSEQEKLTEAETLYGQCLGLILRFGFPRGVYGAFQQFFAPEPPRNPFDEFIEKEIHPRGKPWQPFSPEFRDKQERAANLLEMMLVQAQEEEKNHLEAVCNMWSQRQFGFFRYSFYLGYRYGLSIVQEVAPIGSIWSILDKILLTEHQLAFTFTQAERERELNVQARRKEVGQMKTGNML